MSNIKHIVAFSGGAASSVCAKIVSEMRPNSTTLLFHDTKTEPEDNDRFRKDVSEYVGLPIVEISDGRDIWEIFDDEGYLGNGRNTMCSRILKQELSLKYLLENQPAILYMGFTFDNRDIQRAIRRKLFYRQKGIRVLYPLIAQKITKGDCLKMVECWGIKLPKMYEWAEHANCVPCIKGKLAYWGLIYIYERDAWEKASQKEDEFGNTILADGTLKELLPKCLGLAKKRLKKNNSDQNQEQLFNSPCDCIT